MCCKQKNVLLLMSGMSYNINAVKKQIHSYSVLIRVVFLNCHVCDTTFNCAERERER